MSAAEDEGRTVPFDSLDWSVPYKGVIANWNVHEASDGEGTYLRGTFLNHPDFYNVPGHTSLIKDAHPIANGAGIAIQTLNSRYDVFMEDFKGHEKNLLGLGVEVWAAARNYLKLPGDVGVVPGSFKILTAAEGYGFIATDETVVQNVVPPEMQDGRLTKRMRRKDAEGMAELYRARHVRVKAAMALMTELSHGTSVARGWHDKPREDGTSIALIHSELSEALEGLRKGLKDDHLPDMDSVVVELADALHRIFDFVGKHDLPIGEAYLRKGVYNCGREDHSKEAREKEGGKAF